MANKTLTQEEFQKRIKEYTNDSVKLITPYMNRTTKVTLECNTCHHQWLFSPYNVQLSNMKKHKFNGCPNCKYMEITCLTCGKKFKRLKTDITQNNYCSLSCAAIANNLKNKQDNSTSYRKNAFEIFEHKCAICGWNEDDRVLEVHHLDENRKNNSINNLVILCPICHKYLTLHLYNYQELFNLKNSS